MKDHKNPLTRAVFESIGLTYIQGYVLARSLEGLKQREIAEELGIGQRAISQHLETAIKKLTQSAPELKNIIDVIKNFKL